MSFDHWAAFTAATILVLIIPGPTILLVVSKALAHGRRTALAIVAGVALGDLLAMTASLLGLGALILASSTLFTTLKWCGALYLCWLGLRMILRASRASPMIAGTLTLSASQAFRPDPHVSKTPMSARPPCQQDPHVSKTLMSARPSCQQDPHVSKTLMSARPSCQQDPHVSKTLMSARPSCQQKETS